MDVSPTEQHEPRDVASLKSLCEQVIASKIERYPPEAFSSLSPDQFESIVNLRYVNTAPKENKFKSGGRGLYGSGRMAAAIPDKTMSAIEEVCPAIAESEVVDTLIWKDCVEYKFRLGGPSRPVALNLPWPTLVEKVKKAGDEILILFSSQSEELETKNKMNTLVESIEILIAAPMTVALLTESGAGKSVSKVLKKAESKGNESDSLYDFKMELVKASKIQCLKTNPERAPLTRLKQLQRLLQSWKSVASASGVALSSNAKSVPNDNGRGKKTSEEQHSQDLRVMRLCKSWRELFEALVEREAQMMAVHGERMRNIRNNLEKNKNQVKKASVRGSSTGTFRAVARVKRREDILSKSRGTAKSASILGARVSIGSSSAPRSKVNMLRKEVAIATLRTKGTIVQQTKKASMIGCSVANACGQRKKRTPEDEEAQFGKRGELNVGAGKKMKMPTTRTDGVFSNIHHRMKVKGRR